MRTGEDAFCMSELTGDKLSVHMETRWKHKEAEK